MSKRFQLLVVEPPFESRAYTLQMLWHPRKHGDPAHDWLRSVFARVCGGDRGAR